MLLVIHLCVLSSVALISLGLFNSSTLTAKHVLLPKEEMPLKKSKAKKFNFITLPFASKLATEFKLDSKIRDKLELAKVDLNVAQFVSLKLIGMILGLGTVIIGLKKFDPLLWLSGLSVGYLLPDLWLKRKIKQRKEAIARVLPETVDLIGLCVEAGLDFTTSLKWIIEKKVATNPFLEELAMVLEEIKWGRPRSQALKDMARRLNIPEVTSFVRALVHAERMGTSISEAFTIISEDARLQRYHKGERQALVAPVKILIPLIFCILPVIGIIIGGPIILQFLKGGILTGISK